MDSLSPFLNQLCLWIFVGLMAYAAWFDFREYLIPNQIIVGLLVLYPAFVLTAPSAIEWTISIAIATGILAVGFILFATNKMGGGDVKLLMATGLWAGPEWALAFGVLTALCGGVLSLAYLMRLNYGWAIGWPATETSKYVPYGVAIGAGGLFVAVQLLTTHANQV